MFDWLTWESAMRVLYHCAIGICYAILFLGFFGFVRGAIRGIREARSQLAYIQGQAAARKHMHQLRFDIDPLLSKEENYDRLVDYLEDETPEMPPELKQAILDSFYDLEVYESAIEIQFNRDLEDLRPDHFEEK